MPMDDKLVSKWNKSTSRIPFDRDPSNYAIDKERLFGENSFIKIVTNQPSLTQTLLVLENHL